MTKFYISKVVPAAALTGFVADLNTKTQDGHIAHQERLDRDLWLVRIACTDRADADLVRGW